MDPGEIRAAADVPVRFGLAFVEKFVVQILGDWTDIGLRLSVPPKL